MTSEAFDKGWPEPQRDKRGRFRKGFTGNRLGRPPKRPEPRKSLAKCLTESLAKEIAVNDNGTPQVLSLRDLLVATLLRGALKAKPKDILHIIERVERLAADVALEEDAEDEVFSEEDRRLLEIVRREYDELMCCNCERPVPVRPSGAASRDDFSFD